MNRPRTSLLALAAGLAGLLTVTLTAQTPALSGTWVLDSSRSATPGGAPRGGGGGMAGGGGGGGSMTAAGGGGGARVGGGGGNSQPPEIVVTQSASELVIERQVPSPMKWVYKLDGTESVNTNGRTTTRTKSRWEGRTLVTEGTQVVAMDGGDIRGTIKEVRSLNAEGQLVVETTRTADGMTNAPPVVTQTYRKK